MNERDLEHHARRMAREREEEKLIGCVGHDCAVCKARTTSTAKVVEVQGYHGEVNYSVWLSRSDGLVLTLNTFRTRAEAEFLAISLNAFTAAEPLNLEGE